MIDNDNDDSDLYVTTTCYGANSRCPAPPCAEPSAIKKPSRMARKGWGSAPCPSHVQVARVDDPFGHRHRAEQAVRHLLQIGALPIILGGDHAIPIPVLRAYEGRGPITVVQIDQHIDWRDEATGVHDGLSSPMPRASEMRRSWIDYPKSRS